MTKYFVLLPLFFLSFMVNANEVDLSEMEQIKSEINHKLQAPGQECIKCEHDPDHLEFSQKIYLDSKEKQVKTRYRGGKEAHTIELTRNKDSPERVKLTIHYYQRVCTKHITHTNPLSGGLGFSCAIYESKEREKTIRLDFREASKLESNQKETYQITLDKNLNQRSINHQVQLIQGPHEDVQIEEVKAFLGLFGQRYVIK